MNDSFKAVYRSILYQFLLDIGTMPITISPNEDVEAIKIGRYAGPVAYQLHNLALASMNDFEDFDEAGFWASIEAFNSRNPDIQVKHFRSQFRRNLLIP